MAKITDPDQLNQATEVDFNTTLRTVTLNVAGNLSDDGVRMQALYSFGKEEWIVTAGLKPHPFPWIAIFDESYEMVEDWEFAAASSENLVRDAGVAYRDGTGAAYGAGVIQAEFIGFDSVFALDNNAQSAGDQIYVELDQPNGTTQNMYITGQANQLVKVFDNGTFDYRSNDLRFHVREQGKSYGFNSFSNINVPLPMTYKRYPFPLSNGTDINIIDSDANVDANPPYTGMSITSVDGVPGGASWTSTDWANATSYAVDDVVRDPIRQSNGSSNGTWWICTVGGTSSGTGTADDAGVTWVSWTGERQIGTEWYAFTTIVDGNSATINQIGTYIQRQRRLTTDIDSNVGVTVDGDTDDPLFEREGSTFRTLHSTLWGGVFVDNTLSTEKNFYAFTDNGQVIRTFPFSAGLVLNFSQNYVDSTTKDFNLYYKYISRETDTDVAVTASATNTCTITSTNIDLTTLGIAGDYIEISGFTTNAVNNGVVRITGTPTANALDVISDIGRQFVNETAGDTVNLSTAPYGSPDAVLVNDDTPTAIQGNITSTQLTYSYDYDNNVDGGRTAATDAVVILEAIGDDQAQFQVGEGTIQRIDSNPVNATGGQERVYANA